MTAQSNSFLLVLDPVEERAEQVNSQLRNAGVDVRVLRTAEPAEAERLAREFNPLLILYHPACQPRLTVGMAAEIARRRDQVLAIRNQSAIPGLLAEALETTSCVVLEAGSERQLVDLVRRLAHTAQAGTEQSGLAVREADLRTRHALLLENLTEAVAWLHEGLHVQANAAYLKLMGAQEFADIASLSLLDIAHSDSLDLKQLIRDLGKGVCPAERVLLEFHAPGQPAFSARVQFRLVPFEGEPSIQVILQPLALHASSPVAPTVSGHRDHQRDPLTRLLTRTDFLASMGQALETGAANPVAYAAALHLGVDDAAELEVALSIAELDELVLRLSSLLEQQLHASDLFCRYGDLSFCLFVTRPSQQDIKQLAESLRENVAALGLQPDRLGTAVTCSVGWVMASATARDAEEILQRARRAWQEASASKNSVRRFRPLLQDGLAEDEEAVWEERIRFALGHDDFYSLQQNVHALEGETGVLLENSTFLHEERGDHPASVFMPYAERFELATAIDRQVIPGLLRAISGTGERHIINISDSSLQDFSFPGWLQRQMQQHEIDGTQLVIQFPASGAITNFRSARRLVDELKPLGCRLSVSGYDGDPRVSSLCAQLSLGYARLSEQLVISLRGSRNPDLLQQVRNAVREAEAAGTQLYAADVRNSADIATLWQCGVKLAVGSFLQETPRVIGQ